MEKKQKTRPKGPKWPKKQRRNNTGPAPKSLRREKEEDRRNAAPLAKPVLKAGHIWIYGRHAAVAAISNKLRRIHRVFATPNALKWLQGQEHFTLSSAPLTEITPQEIDALLPEGAVHQGICVETEPLPRSDLAALIGAPTSRPVIVLDQITDPQNIGAIFRSAAAFGASAIIVQDRRTPPLAGALAKAAAGAVEKVACIEVVNIARTLRELREYGYYCLGLAGGGSTSIAEAPKQLPLAIVLGAEGGGLRELVARNCDGLYRIPIAAQMESLNVSNAAAIMLYEATRQAEEKDNDNKRTSGALSHAANTRRHDAMDE